MNGIHVEDRGAARWFIFDRADCRNALDPDALPALAEAIRDAKDARVLVLAGRNAAFSSGADLRYAVSAGPELFEQLERYLHSFQELIRALVDAPQPTVAVVDGPAYGFGCDLALACDLRVGSTRAYFQEGFVRIGLIPDGGGTWMLPRLVGLSKAMELMLLGDRLEAAEAQRLGLLARLVAPDALDATAEDVVGRLVNGPPLALRHIRRLAREGLSKDFATAYADEGRAQLECLRSADCVEGVSAFFKKRAPTFTGA
jgi:enoyl-CoA hydratase/carnithine racemase